MRINFKLLLYFVFLNMFFLLPGEALQVVMEDFSSLEGLKIAGSGYSPESKVDLVTDPAITGTAAKFSFTFGPGATYNYVELVLNRQLPIDRGSLGLWVHGTQSNPLYLRVVDKSGETFQYSLGALNTFGAWKFREVDLSNYLMKWGGNGNGIIDLPAVVWSILVDKPPLESGIAYFDELTLKSEDTGLIRGVIRNLDGLPVENVNIAIDTPENVQVTSEKDGSYSLLLGAGTHSLIFSKKGFESVVKNLTVATGEIQTQNLVLKYAPDYGVYSDRGRGEEDGLRLLDGLWEAWKGEIGEIGGRRAVKTNKNSKVYYLIYNLDDSYLYDGENKAYVSIEYFDLGTDKIALQYDAGPGNTHKLAGIITRSNTNTWKTATFYLEDARFANGTNSGDFWIATYVPGFGFQQDAYIGKVSVVKAGQVLSLDIWPKRFSPQAGGFITVDYRLSVPGIVSLWVEDTAGGRVATLAAGRTDSLSGSYTWAGITDLGQNALDGSYYLKMELQGIGWYQPAKVVGKVEILAQKPDAPTILLPEVSLTTCENRILILGRGKPGSALQAYLRGTPYGENRLVDARGDSTFIIEGLEPGENVITLKEIDPYGNESAPSLPVVVNYSPEAAIGQLTVSPRSFNPKQEQATVNFLSQKEQTLKLAIASKAGKLMETTISPRAGEMASWSWDGLLGGKLVPDGSYNVEVYNENNVLLGKAWLELDTAPPREPILLLPGLKATVAGGNMRFSWEGGQDTSRYLLKTWPGWAPELVEQYEVFQTEYYLQSPLPQGRWLWQVEAWDSAGNHSQSGVSSFTINNELAAELEIQNLQVAPNPFMPNENGFFDNAQLSYTLTQAAQVGISIYNLSGSKVFERAPTFEETGDHHFTWDGRDKRGMVVERGLYILVIAAKNDENRAPAKARTLISVIY